MSPAERAPGPSSTRRVQVRRTVVVPAAPAEVWARIATAEGIADELRPWLTMSKPRGLAAQGLTADLVGRPLGRAWLRLGGVVPVEYDDLFLVEVDAPRRFHERSSMALARSWEHRRDLEPAGPGHTRVTDLLVMEPRLPLPRAPLRSLIDALFAHRHRRLRRHFAR